MNEYGSAIPMDHFDKNQIFHLFRMINRIRKTRKSILLYFDGNEYTPVYSEGYGFTVFSRLKVPESVRDFIDSRKIDRFFNVDDTPKNPIIYEMFTLHGIAFLYITSDYHTDSQKLPISILKEDFFRQGNLLALKKCEFFLEHCQNSLTLHFIDIKYGELLFHEILKTEAGIYKRAMTLFASHSLVIRVDFGKLLILSDYTFYPDPSSIQVHVSEILNDMIPDSVTLSVKTMLSDPSLISEKEIIDEFFA